MIIHPIGLDCRRLLVIAPHPDDETLGCGGLIALTSNSGGAVHTIFVTDGGASHPNSRAWPRPRLSACREAEAAAALDYLGAGHQPRLFLRLRDADMPQLGSPIWREAQAAVETVLRTFRPDLVLLPWRRDPHRDHRDSWTLTTAAIDAARVRPATLEYAIWLDELGAPEDRPREDEAARIAIDIAQVVRRKRHAVDMHRSQTTAMINDDPGGFRLTAATIERLTLPTEFYWQPL